MGTTDRLLTLSDIARKLQISRTTLKRWIAAGTFPKATVKLSERGQLWPESLVADWVKTRTESLS